MPTFIVGIRIQSTRQTRDSLEMLYNKVFQGFFVAFLPIPSFLALVYDMKNSVVLTFASLMLLLWFILLPGNRQWFNLRIIGYWNDFLVQKDSLDLEHRKIKRWEESYTVSKQIANLLPKGSDKNTALVLIPPSTYFAEKKIGYHVPEPAVFYYYTGLKTTWINSSEAPKANWMVTADNGYLKLVPVINQKTLVDSINAFKKYPVN
jgi:hypothetical protein